MSNLAEAPSRLFLGLIPWYGVLIVLGAGLAILLADREANRQGLEKDTIIDLALWLLPMGILGARIYYVIFSWDTFQSNPVSILYIWQGGLAIYGGLIAGFCVVIVFCRRRKLSIPQLLDILIPGVALAQAIGRWGNYFNQEAFGLSIASDSPLAFFPLAVRIQAEGGAWHLATFFYESVLDLAIFLFLIWGRKHIFRKKGDVFLGYIILYSAGRAAIEGLRMDSLYLAGSIRVSQLLSLALCVGGIVLWMIRRRRQK